MADFLVKNKGPARVTLVIPTDKGRACVHLDPVKHGRMRRVSVPDELVSKIDPAHAAHMVKLNTAAPVVDASSSTDPVLPDTEQPTQAATPESKARGKRIENVQG